jgi:hypothetical protein
MIRRSLELSDQLPDAHRPGLIEIAATSALRDIGR